jgi:golgi-specific brefeldin A-resistance guanine nucleotide exchange factor 1
VLEGLSTCIDEPGPLRSEMMTSPDFWAILRALTRNPDAMSRVFEILEKGTTGSPPAIIADNYEAAISLLNDFASAASVPVPGHEPKSEAGPRKSDVASKQTKRSVIIVWPKVLLSLTV